MFNHKTLIMGDHQVFRLVANFQNIFLSMLSLPILFLVHCACIIDKTYTFEIGGKGKTAKQIQGVKNGYVVRDDMEVGSLNVIPLYIFGFLY